MSLIVADNLTQIFGAEEVLTNVSFHLADNSRVGLVGPNGGGKTTLLRILAGCSEPTSGRVQRPETVRIGYLPQAPPAPGDVTLHESMLKAFDDVRRIQRELESLAGQLDGNPGRTDRFGRLQVAFDANGGYDYTHRIEAVLTGLGFPQQQWAQPLSQLSGGQRTRAYLGRILLQRPDLLLLDEPTNHLDLDSLEWLERWLGSFTGALLLVSHDRYLLDRTTNETWEVGFAALERYRGCYSHYLAKREARFSEQMRRWQAQQQYIADSEQFIRRNLAGQRTKEAQGRRTRLERFMKTEAIARPRRSRRIHVNFAGIERSGEMVLRATDLEIGYDRQSPLMHVDRLEISRGQKIAIVGANGIGKTTLLRTLLGKLPALAGKVRYGANVRSGYLSQSHEDLDPQATAMEALQASTGLKDTEARDLLGSLLFSGDDVFKTISQLSGGQRSRIVVARLVARKANVLLLDEPTNHLDIPAQEILQQVLQDFDGTVIFVSHDRYLIDAVATDVWVIAGGGIAFLPGRWDAYLAWRSGTGAGKAEPANGEKAKLSRKDAYRQRRRRQNELQRMRRNLNELENNIARLESDIKQLHDDISAAGEAGDMDRIDLLGQKYEANCAALKELNGQWERLGEELETAGRDE